MNIAPEMSVRPRRTTYRPDVDGLRGLAILLVIFYHAFPRLLPGGFIGVDVFFVISGFLITRTIRSDLECGQFSLSDFYLRRILRIVPPLLPVLLTTALLGCGVLLAGELVRLGRHIMAGSAFYANWQLLYEAGYFDLDSRYKPLLHLWSLSIEEQFYLIWPLLLFFTWKRGARGWIVVIGCLSFGFNLYISTTNSPFAFYSLPSRFWELLFGCILAMSENSESKNLSTASVLSALACCGLIGSGLIFSSSLPYPSWPALFPVVCAGVLIWYGQAAKPALILRATLPEHSSPPQVKST